MTTNKLYSVMTLATLFYMALAAAGQTDVSDHPLLSRFQGSEVVQKDVSEFNEFPLALGPIVDIDKWAKSESLEGKVTKIKYTTPEKHAGLEIIRNYQDALQKSGFQILYACDGQKCFDDKWPYGYKDTASGIWCYNCEEPMHYLAAKISRETGDAYVSLLVLVDKYEGGTWLNIIEVKPMQTGLVTVDAQALAKDITVTGHVAVYGIYFDTGKAVVKPESKPVIEEIAKLLDMQPTLKLHVVGHTDNVGSLAANMTLSKQRAAAVVNMLIKDHGIAASRLIANGVGPLAPVAPNADEGGRAKNRRVELVPQ